MQVLLTGGTGFIGSVVLDRLLKAGHSVTAVVRSDKSAEAVTSAGATAVVGNLADAAWLASQLRGVDGAIHTAAPDDGSAASLDDAMIAAAIDAFAGTDKRFVYTTGVWIYGEGEVTEETPIDAPEITSWREARQARLLGSGVNAVVIAPGIVYGYGKGIPNTISGAPKTADGALTLVGSGDQHWTTVHVDDLADLFLLAFEKSEPGEVYIGVSGVNPTVRELGQAVVGADGTVVPDSEDATRERLGGHPRRSRCSAGTRVARPSSRSSVRRGSRSPGRFPSNDARFDDAVERACE
jgi:nucleoside-diphosphate-sugar epimerase